MAGNNQGRQRSMGETRVNLKHLLEDIRDGYGYGVEEAILAELVANALDSGASRIQFFTYPKHRRVMVIDNGNGMSERDFEAYHDIAASTKARGKGIGFAGVGVKLALLVAKTVTTETRSGRFHRASEWRLESQRHAPWRFVPPAGAIDSVSGTAVTADFRSADSRLLDPDFIEAVIQKHFFTILHEDFMNKTLRGVYPRGVSFYVNGNYVAVPEDEELVGGEMFYIYVGRQRKHVGYGLLGKSRSELPEDRWGLAVSTYGKVIKRGWDWLSLTPRNPMQLSGIVEIPALSEILTTNKSDFLKDAVSLQKYYRYRKAVQQAVDPILKKLGEVTTPRPRRERDLRPIEREIQRVLGRVINDFPELSPLLARQRKGERVRIIIPDPAAPPAGVEAEGVGPVTGTEGGGGAGGGIDAAPGDEPGRRIEPADSPVLPGFEHAGRRRSPGLKIGFDDNPERREPGWITENVLWINRAHPAFRKAQATGAESYHLVFAVGWVLSTFLDEDKSPQEFMNRFLSGWGAAA
jgi:hypothetical protein